MLKCGTVNKSQKQIREDRKKKIGLFSENLLFRFVFYMCIFSIADFSFGNINIKFNTQYGEDNIKT